MKTNVGAVSAMVVLVLAVGCGPSAGDSFRRGVPGSTEVSLKLPGSVQQPLTAEGTRRDGLEGERAALYTVTREVTVVVNGGVGSALALIEKIVSYPPSTVSENTATWGPVTDSLSPTTWKLTVTQDSPTQYHYALVAKAKAEPDSAYRTILSGTHSPTGTNLGSGTLLIDWDQAQQLPEHDANVGTASVTYSHLTADAKATIDVQFKQVRDADSGQRIDSKYGYEATPGQGGAFNFSAHKNLAPGDALEQLTVRSRWVENGAGRSDVQVNGGDLADAATVNECWDSAFASRYFLASWAATGNYGTTGACAFAAAEYVTP